MLAGIPPQYRHSEVENEILAACLIGKMQLWVCFSFEPGNLEARKIWGTGLTGISVDFFTKSRNLVVYSLHSFGAGPSFAKAIAEAFETVREYAKATSCQSIVFYTHHEALADYFKRQYGSDISQRVVLTEVRNGR